MKRRSLMYGLVALAALLAAGGGAQAQLFTDQFNSAYYTIVSAAQADNIAEVRVFISKRVNVNQADTSGRTAMSYAAELGDAQMVKELVDARASPDQRDKQGDAPLHWAANNGRIEAIKALLAGHAIVDATDRQGITPLMSAIAHKQVASVRALLTGGADPKKTDFTGRDAVGWAAGQPDIVRMLKEPKS